MTEPKDAVAEAWRIIKEEPCCGTPQCEADLGSIRTAILAAHEEACDLCLMIREFGTDDYGTCPWRAELERLLV